FFEGLDLIQPPDMAILAKKFRAEESAGQFAGDFRPDDARAENQDIHIVVLDSLMGRMNIVAKPGAYARNLVGGDGRAHTAATHDDAPFCLPGDDGSTHRGCKIGIIDRIIRVCPTIHYRVAHFAQERLQMFFKLKAGVIRTDDDAHGFTSSIRKYSDWSAAKAGWSLNV